MNRISFAAVGALLALVVACGGAPSKSVAANPDKPTATASVTAAHAPQTLLDVQGSGIKTTQAFTTSGDWTISWTAHDTSGVSGYFGIYVYDAGSQVPAGVAGNVQVPANQTLQDVSHGHQAGKWYLEVNSASTDWHVTVTG
jgi:hypothetical protein